jgi:enoyl-CoA hydratase/carnithine racemase
VHGKYRIATEHTVFGMPETGIGLFPDVGSMFWMPRVLPTMGLAVYLGLTGRKLQANDVLYCGLATHYVPAAKLDDLTDALAQATSRNESVTPVLMSFHERPPIDPSDSHLAQHADEINQVFGNPASSLLDMMQALEFNHNNTDFGQATLQTLHKQSPTSMMVTLEGLRRGAQHATMAQDLTMEYRMSQAFMRADSDFYEGIRATLIDKDRNPQWKPSRVEDVTDDMVESYFAPIEHEWNAEEVSAGSSNNSAKL